MHKGDLNLPFRGISDPRGSQLEVLNVFLTFKVVFCLISIPNESKPFEGV